MCLSPQERRALLDLVESVDPTESTDPVATRPLGVDDLLPAGWGREAHKHARSPWDAELSAAQRVLNGQSVLRELAADLPVRTQARLPPDRRATEIDWRRHSEGERQASASGPRAPELS